MTRQLPWIMNAKQALQAQRRRERRAALNDLKLSRGGCIDCGYNGHPAALQWDHVRGEKVNGNERHALHPNWAWARILAEVAKCELVCANCHAIRTAERGYTGGSPMHRHSRPRVRRGEFGIDRDYGVALSR